MKRNETPMDFDSILYRSGSFPQPKRGDLLIAQPLMQDSLFGRGVILLLDRDSKGGYLGLLLNKNTSYTFEDIVPSEWESTGEVDLRSLEFYCGGPVDGERLFFLHALPEVFPGSMEVLPGIYVGGDEDQLVKYLHDGGEVDGKLKFVLGYSGWEKDQLESELLRNSWALNPNPESEGLLQGEGDEVWRREVKRLGSEYSNWLMAPANPRDN